MPQILWIIFLVIELTIAILLHGNERPNYNCVVTFLNCVGSVFILYWGGFFNCFFK